MCAKQLTVQLTKKLLLTIYCTAMVVLQGLTVEERRPSYDELQRRLVEEVPMVFLFHEDQLFVNSQRISNIPYEIFKLRGWKYWEWNVE